MFYGRMKVWLLAATAATAVACWDSGPPRRDEELKVGPSFSRASVWGADLFVKLAPGIPLSAMVDLSVFAPLKPEMTLEEARRTVGEPLASRPYGAGTAYLYRDDAARVELAHIVESSSGSTWQNWSVFSTPERNSVKDILAEPVVGLVNTTGKVNAIVIHENRQPLAFAFSAQIVGEKVLLLRWYAVKQ